MLFLDEPTTGLDPTSRARMWDVIRALVADGATLLLTTQYLDEADQLADEIVVIDHGRAIARGTATQLKAQTGGATLHITLPEPATDAALHALAPLVAGEIKLGAGGHDLTAPVAPRPGLATGVVRALDQAGVAVDDVEVRRPSLDDVFFALTAGDPGPDRTTPPITPNPRSCSYDRRLDPGAGDSPDAGRDRPRLRRAHLAQPDPHRP